MHDKLADHVQRIVANMDEQHNDQEQDIAGVIEQDTQPEETIHIHYFPDAIVIVKEENDNPQHDNTVESTLAQPKKPPVFMAYAICLMYLFLIVSCIAFQLYCIVNPPIATVTIVPKTKTINLTGTMQLGRVLHTLTISQSRTIPTTGRGHQDAQASTGFITFYNGLFTSQTIATGTILTGADGVQIITDQDATIPAGNPPSYGQVTVSAHAVNTGTKGNIPAYDINQACCANAILAKNTQSFSGGQNERDFSTVSHLDIHTLTTQLVPTVAQSMQAALQGQLTPLEQMQLLPCTPTLTSDKQPGQEATQVKVTVSETCSAVAYNQSELVAKATDFLTHQTATTLATSYSRFGAVKVSVSQAVIQRQVILSFHAQGTWIYALSQQAQEQIKRMISGKTKQAALHLLAALPGVAQASINWGDDSRLPKDSGYMHLVLFIG